MFASLQRKQDGWLAVGFSSGRLDIAHVQRSPGHRPRLRRLESYSRPGDDQVALTMLGKHHKLAPYRCTTLLASGAYQMLQLDAPVVPPEELREAVRWQLKDLVEFAVDTASVDVLTLPVGQMPGRPQSIIAVAASEQAVAPRMKLFDKARLNLCAIDIPEMAQRNVAALFEDEGRGLALLSLDENGGLLTFTYRGELCVARRIELTSQQLAAADSARRTQMYERIGLELQRSLDNFERLYNMISVSKVVVGPCPFAPGLVEYLHDYVYIPVQTADLTTVIDCDDIPEIRNVALQAERLSVIGAALRDDVGLAA